MPEFVLPNFLTAAGGPLSPDQLLVGSLLLHHLQLLQFNAHEVGEYVMMEPGQFRQSRSVYIGVAVYPTVSFFNHSCEGGVSRWVLQWSSASCSGGQDLSPPTAQLMNSTV